MARLLGLLLAHLELSARLVLDLDDTLFHKCGRKVSGAGSFRDPSARAASHRVRARPRTWSCSRSASAGPGRWAARPAHQHAPV